MPLAEIIDFNEIIDNKPFLYQPVKKQTRSVWKTCQKKDDYTTGNLLDYLYHQNYHKLMVWIY